MHPILSTVVCVAVLVVTVVVEVMVDVEHSPSNRVSAVAEHFAEIVVLGQFSAVVHFSHDAVSVAA